MATARIQNHSTLQAAPNRHQKTALKCPGPPSLPSQAWQTQRGMREHSSKPQGMQSLLVSVLHVLHQRTKSCEGPVAVRALICLVSSGPVAVGSIRDHWRQVLLRLPASTHLLGTFLAAALHTASRLQVGHGPTAAEETALATKRACRPVARTEVPAIMI